MGKLVVITGPIAAGKSTVAEALAGRLVTDGRSAAVVDLDSLVFDMLRAPLAQFDESWRRARQVHGVLVAAWLDAGIDVVVAHGPFLSSEDDEVLLARTSAVTPIRVLLRVPFAVACTRVGQDPTRVVSADLGFLRSTHDRFAELEPDLAPCDHEFGTSTTSVDHIVDSVVATIG